MARDPPEIYRFNLAPGAVFLLTKPPNGRHWPRKRNIRTLASLSSQCPYTYTLQSFKPLELYHHIRYSHSTLQKIFSTGPNQVHLINMAPRPMVPVYIVSAVRTPIGQFQGYVQRTRMPRFPAYSDVFFRSLASQTAIQLGSHAIKCIYTLSTPSHPMSQANSSQLPWSEFPASSQEMSTKCTSAMSSPRSTPILPALSSQGSYTERTQPRPKSCPPMCHQGGHAGLNCLYHS